MVACDAACEMLMRAVRCTHMLLSLKLQALVLHVCGPDSIVGILLCAMRY